MSIARSNEGGARLYKEEEGTDYDAVATRLFELVKAGQLSEEQAKAMLDVARKVGGAKKAD